MGTLFIDTGGATTNSGSTDANSADVTLTVHASYAGGATIQVTVNTGSLASVVTSGASQSTVYFANATNSNQKIFWISAVDNVSSPKTITTTVAPTGLTAGTSTGAIGGRFIYKNTDLESALRAGDTVIINNSPANHSGSAWHTCRVSGDSAAGPITIKGKSGVRPVITITDTSVGIGGNSATNRWFENLEFAQQGASGNVFNSVDRNATIYNIKISDGGGSGITTANQYIKIIGCEISGCGGDGINGPGVIAIGNYIHDNTGDGIETTGNLCAINNIIDTNGGRGINDSGSYADFNNHSVLFGNTLYLNGNSGLEVADADRNITLIGNLFQDNGNAAGEFNVEWVAGAAEYSAFHAYNVFSIAGSVGGGNLSALTQNAHVASSEVTTDPKLVDPGNGDFRTNWTGSGFQGGFPAQFLGGGNTKGFLDIGAVQTQRGTGRGRGNAGL